MEPIYNLSLVLHWVSKLPILSKRHLYHPYSQSFKSRNSKHPVGIIKICWFKDRPYQIIHQKLKLLYVSWGSKFSVFMPSVIF